MGRCTWRGLDHFKTYVWSSVVAYNLVPDEIRAKAKSIINYCRACCRSEIEFSECQKIIAGIAGCDAGELAA